MRWVGSEHAPNTDQSRLGKSLKPGGTDWLVHAGRWSRRPRRPHPRPRPRPENVTRSSRVTWSPCSNRLEAQAPRRIALRRRSQWFSHISSAISRDSRGVLMPTGVAESRSRSQSSQTTSHRRSDRCTILEWWTFRNALCNRPPPAPQPPRRRRHYPQPTRVARMQERSSSSRRCLELAMRQPDLGYESGLLPITNPWAVVSSSSSAALRTVA